MSGGGGGGVAARVSTPAVNVRKMIGEIKRLAAGGKFTDEFINSLLKECGFDSNEVVRRLKMIGEIKEIAKKHGDEDVHIMLKECNMDPNEAAQRLLYIDTFSEVKKKRDKKNVIVNNGTYEDYRRAPGKQWQGTRGGQGNYNPSNDVGGRRTVSSMKENGFSNRSRTERVSSSNIPVQHNKENNVSPHVASSSPVRANGPTVTPDGFSNHGSATQQSAGVSSSASSPVVVPSLTKRNVSVAGTKKGEVDNQSGIAEAVAIPLVGNTGSVVQDIANTSRAATDSLNGTMKVVASEEESNPKLEKLTLSADLPVTFPDHLQVPETFKKRLTFGSLDAALGDENSSSSIEPVQANDVMEASMRIFTIDAPLCSSQSVTSNVREDELPSHSLPPPIVPESALPSAESVLSDSSLTPEQSKQETMPPQAASQIPFPHSTTNYGFGLHPHYLGILPPEVPENQSGNSLVASTSPATTSITPSSGAAQNPLSPPPFPLFQQPFAHGYFPYGPYYPHYYWPPNAHHMMGHGGFPQQPYVVPPGVKFPVPSPYMQGNLGHFGIPPSSYGAYGPSPAGSTADATPGLAANEVVAASQTKEKSINSAKSPVLQGEAASNREMPSMPNYFYHLPQGHHMTYSPAIYHHPPQTMSAQSTVQPPLHQSEPMAAESLEASVEPPSKSYEQPQHAPQIS